MKTTRHSRKLFGGIRGILAVVALVIVAFALGALVNRDPATRGDVGIETAAHSEPTMWTCSMHPQIRLPEEGKCPICFMDLIPSQSGSTELGPRQLSMSETARALARVETTPAIRQFAEAEVRMYGRIAYDESRVSYITAWVPGRLDRLFADYTGVSVNKGDHLAEMYSPELLIAQEEFAQALAAERAIGSGGSDVMRAATTATVKAAREKLRLQGLTAQQIGRIEKTGQIAENVTIFAPAGGVVVEMVAREGMYVKTGTRIYTIADLEKLWVLFEAYESDLPWIHYGQRVQFTTQSFPGETFSGVISFVDPLVDSKTRTVRVRVTVDNKDGRLKPDMFVRGSLKSRIDAHRHVIDVELAGKWICPMHPEIVADGPDDCEACGMDLVPAASLGFVKGGDGNEEAPVLIPASAPLITGRRAVVYVETAAAEGTVFEGREVRLGPRAGDFYVVQTGIDEGESVVTNGAFKIDSELQLQARPSMMSPEGGASPQHEHGGDDQHQHSKAKNKPDMPVAPAEGKGARLTIAPVYNAYFELQMALAHDDLKEAKKHASVLAGAVSAVDTVAFSARGRLRWRQLVPTLDKETKRLASTSDIEQARDAFYSLSEVTIGLQRVFGHASDADHYLAHCPMARNGDGAYWLQKVDVVWNSFWGSRMLHCGSIEETFTPARETGKPANDARKR